MNTSTIIRRHLDAWINDPNLTLPKACEAMINETISELAQPDIDSIIQGLRTESGWWVGDDRAREVLGAYVAKLKSRT